MKVKTNWFIFVPATIAAVTLQILKALNISLSFPVSESVFYISIAAVIIMAVISILDRKTLTVYKIKKSMTLGVFSMIAGFTTILGSAGYFYASSNKTLSAVQIANIIFGILAGFVFLFIASGFFRGETPLKSVPVFLLIPSISCALSLIIKFMDYTKQAVASCEMYDLIFYIPMLLFLFYFASIFAGAATKNAVKCCFYFGFVSVMYFSIWCVDIVHEIINTPVDVNIFEYGQEISAFGITLLTLVYLIELSVSIGSKNEFDYENVDFSEEEKIFGKIKRNLPKDSDKTEEQEDFQKVDIVSDLQENGENVDD